MDSNNAIDLQIFKSAFEAQTQRIFIMSNANETTTNTTAKDLSLIANIVPQVVGDYYNHLLQVNTRKDYKISKNIALKNWRQCGLKNNVEIVCGGKTLQTTTNPDSYLGWVQLIDPESKRTFNTLGEAEVFCKGKGSGSMESFFFRFEKDNKKHVISVAKLRANLLQSYFNDELGKFDLVKVSEEQKEVKITGEKTKASLKASQEALKKETESKLAAMRKVAEQQKYIEVVDLF